MENIITVEITAEDRENYDFEQPKSCPLAKALARRFPRRNIIVFNDTVRIDIYKYAFSDKVYNEKVVKKAKRDITVVLNKIFKHEKVNGGKT